MYRQEKYANKDDSVGGYSNSSNPWGDENLTEKFEWKKKREREIELGVDIEAKEKEKQEDMKRELEKAKKRRSEREMEKQWRRDERQRVQQQQQDPTAHKDVEREEEEFLLKQAKLRAEIRLKDGRAKPIDLLYKNVTGDAKFGLYSAAPYDIFDGATYEDLLEIRDDIAQYLQLDSAHRSFWQAMQTLCVDEISKKSDAALEEAGVHKSIATDVSAILGGKSSQQLSQLETQINAKLNSGGAVDHEYWQGLLNKLVIYKAKAMVLETHSAFLQQHGGKIETGKYVPPKQLPPTTQHAELSPPVPKDISDPAEQKRQQLLREAQKIRDRGGATPKIEKQLLTEDEMYRQEAESHLVEPGEEPFNAEYPLEPKEYPWQDQYTPKKPKFFNRIKTGYDWNKYNQTHYDDDHPPPKIVEGYRFNIFYPDLLDKKKSPMYKVEKDPESPDFVVLRFTAGPPYSDIGFKIVNKEWEYSHKKGFRCTFESGALRMILLYKKYKYRR